MYYVGLDVHKNRSSLSILDDHGAKIKRMEIKGPWSELLPAMAQLPRPFQVCYEATCGYGYLHDQLQRSAQRVAVAHPGHLRLIFRSKKKNDRVDADKLAKLLYLDEVPTVHVPGVDVRSWRGLIEYRRRLVQSRTGVKNQIRALLRGLGMAAPRCLGSNRGLESLRQHPMEANDGLRLEIMLEEMQGLSRKIKRVQEQLATMARVRRRCVGCSARPPGRESDAVPVWPSSSTE
jgi:transposase